MNARLRVLHAFSTFSLGGAQARFVQVANAIGDQAEHIIVSMDNQWQAGERLSSSVPWRRLEVSVVRGAGLGNRGAFRRVLRQVRADVVMTYNWGAMEWVAANIPAVARHVHVEDGFGRDEAHGQKSRRVWARRLLLALSRATLVVPSRTLQSAARQWWVPVSRTVYIPNGVELVEPRAPRPLDGAVVIGTVAGLRPEKRLDRLLRSVSAAVSRGYDLKLVIVGDGAERDHLQRLASQLSITERIEFTGFRAAPLQELARMDLFALSSDTEQQPLSLLEAMTLAMPVVSTRVGDIANMVPFEMQSCLSDADDDAFTSTLLRVLEQRECWAAWGQAGLRKVRSDYSSEAMLEAWGRVILGDAVAQSRTTS